MRISTCKRAHMAPRDHAKPLRTGFASHTADHDDLSIHIGEAYAQIRADNLGAGPISSPAERLQLQQQWPCELLDCQLRHLVDKAST